MMIIIYAENRIEGGKMGDILDNIKAAASGNPYAGEGTDDIKACDSQSPIMGSPAILRHSLYGNPVIMNPMTLNENGLTVDVSGKNDLE